MLQLTEIELKLLRLALDLSAQGAEISTSAVKFVESLRRRGVNSSQIEEALYSETVPPKQWKPDYGLSAMPFGPRKGERFMDISPYELRKARDWAMHKPDLAQKFAEFIHDVNEFLKQ